MINNVIVQGRLTKDVELKQTQNGFAFCNFTVAWSEKYKEVETVCFVNCKAWRNTAEFISKYFGKGSEIVVSGRLTDEDWGKDGQKNIVKVVDVREAHFCGSKSGNTQPGTAPATTGSDAFMPISDGEELPFE